MIFTRTRTLRFNMGPYEHLEISATVQADPSELDVASAFTVGEQLDTILDDLLRGDVDRADDASKTPEDNTFLHAWKDTLDA